METLQGSKNKMKPLTIEQLKSLEVGDYIWYERLGTNTKGYIKKNTTSPDVFCMFIGHPVDYSDYGKTWLAWKNKEQAECKGEIVELPCKVGDTVYVINYQWLKYREYKVRAIEIRTSDIFFTLTDDLGDKFRVKGVWAEQVSINSFKDEWFLTREEAEKRLEELKNAERKKV